MASMSWRLWCGGLKKEGRKERREQEEKAQEVKVDASDSEA